MRKFGKASAYDDLKQRIKSFSIICFAEVEEFESAIAYIGPTDAIQFLQMDVSPTTTGTFTLEHQTVCIDRNQPVMQFSE